MFPRFFGRSLRNLDFFVVTSSAARVKNYDEARWTNETFNEAIVIGVTGT